VQAERTEARKRLLPIPPTVSSNSKNRILKTMRITILSIAIFLVSCNTERDERFNKLICGEWNFARIEQNNHTINPDNVFPRLKIPWNKMIGYIFSQDNLCEKKPGFFYPNRGSIVYLGIQTKYKIENGNLKIFNLVDSTWESNKIYEITPGTLTLIHKDGFLVKYAKANYKVDEKQLFDEIIVSSSHCQRQCEVNDIRVNKRGEVIFSSQESKTATGLFTSKISRNDYFRIEQRFKKSNIAKLEHKYDCNESSSETVSITFIKDNSIYKTVSDRGYMSPIEFYWAYMPLWFLKQTLKLKPLVVSNFKQLSSNRIILKSKGIYCDLEKSEMFYLITELYKSKEVKQSFESKYNIVFWNNELKKYIIKTDGRFYQIEKNGLSVTVDLGYNFVTKNDLSKKFRKIDE